MDAYRRWAVPVVTASLLIAPVGDITIALLLGIALELAVIRVLWRDLIGWRAAAMTPENKTDFVLDAADDAASAGAPAVRGGRGAGALAPRGRGASPPPRDAASGRLIIRAARQARARPRERPRPSVSS